VRLVLPESNLDPGRGGVSVRVAAYTEGAYVREGHAVIMESVAAEFGKTPSSVGYLNTVALSDPRAVHRTA
jgi:hypothetical protein